MEIDYSGKSSCEKDYDAAVHYYCCNIAVILMLSSMAVT